MDDETLARRQRQQSQQQPLRGLRPIDRVGQGALAGALATLVIFALNHLTGGEVRVPGEVGAAIATAASFVVGCAVRERAPDAEEADDGLVGAAAGDRVRRRRTG